MKIIIQLSKIQLLNKIKAPTVEYQPQIHQPTFTSVHRTKSPGSYFPGMRWVIDCWPHKPNETTAVYTLQIYQTYNPWLLSPWSSTKSKSSLSRVSLNWILEVLISVLCRHAISTQIVRFMGPMWGPPGADRTQVGPMLAPWTLLSGYVIPWWLSHLPLVPHICASVNYVSTGSGNGLSPIWHQAITWTDANLLSIGPLRTNFSELEIKIQNFLLMKMHLNMLSVKCHFVQRGMI